MPAADVTTTPTWVRNRWLHVFFAATMALTLAVAVLGWSPWSSRWPAYLMIAVLVVAYVAYGRRGYDEPRAAAGFLPLVLVAAVVLPAVAPSTAFVQCILFPLVWCQSERIRSGVLLTVAVGVLSAVGLMVSGGPDALVSTLLIEGISVIGSCAMGGWISSVAALSEERRQLVEDLRAAQQSLADANRAAGIASERERLAREIHDTVAQNLAGIVMLTERARNDLADDRPDALDERLTVLEESARAALEESRVLVAAGSAGTTRDSLAGALHRLGERHTRETGTPVTVSAADGTLDRDAQVVLLRVAQEALSNVRAHAGSTGVVVTLLHEPDRTVLRIADDGAGFDPAVPTAGHGLRGLRERLALAGGTCVIASTPGSGTTVTASLPAVAPTPAGAAPSLPARPHAAAPAPAPVVSR
ncbi:signal transduction histidine kinase [Curtobacterium herbarum]|uniref:sensor histidine kinase n=1 Tax=Curtobacterium herbarum TaxID=150122 RepID=UPI00209E7B70|nr:sensor histidine kinase [Curtobacterium herbarum]MCP1501518.1 signal transduction histidine kinase [Curtobacterium herbarum]